MEYITAMEAAGKWGISDRRVRVLCSQGRIPGAHKDGKSYRIPADATKPADGRERGNKQANDGKQRISPLHNDVESEVAVSLLAELLGVPVCPVVRTVEDTVFSTFMNDFSKEYIVHFRRLFGGARSDNEYQNLIGVRPQYNDDFARMILLNFITRQDDRHMSNMAIKIGSGGESFYALYDNGRSLFYEDTEETVREAISDPAKNATRFGYSGTYWDYVQEIAAARGSLEGLIDLNVGEKEVRAVLTEAGFTGYRYDGALVWILKTIILIREHSRRLIIRSAKSNNA